ncbi:response regulator [Phenylobacterium sp. LjRoot225]|uniref:response regulator n=1 Tax=Phenylobacterium sp. LjRoot225 TaxID=3342285 RepID=UPI003ECFE3B0
MAEPARPRIAIVDDQAANVAALCQTLAERGYDPIGFTDGGSALSALQDGGFEVLLTDLAMPGMGGVELLRLAQERDPDLVGVIMTGEASVSTAVEAMKTGALDYVLKPLKLSTILPVLSRAMAVRRLRLEKAELERRVHERTQALEAALRRVEEQTAERIKAEHALVQAQKLETIGRITGGVAHDFNNLLMAVDGAFRLLDRRLEPGHPCRRYIDAGLQATQRGVKVTGQLLAFSRTQKLDLQPTDLSSVLRGGAPMIAHALGPTISFNLVLPEGEAWATTDADQLELALVNLALNARDAMPEGGAVVLGLAVNETPGAAPVWRVWMSDTGHGMPQDVAVRAVEPFYTTKEKGKGTGLGLAQVYGFARQCGGDVAIDSMPGAGATVEIQLPSTQPRPRSAERAAKSQPENPAYGDQGSSQRILVVDDDDAVRMVLADGLRLDGFQVFEAADGPSGLALMERQSLDAVVLDFAMPGMNGAELAKRVRALRPGLPVAFCSGYADTLALEDVQDAIVLRKPIAVSTLGRAVADLLAKSAA